MSLSKNTRVIIGIENLPDELDNSAVSIGMFDGVHLGHQLLLAVLESESKRVKGTSVVLTFDRHPLELLSPDKSPHYITTLGQKLGLLQDAEADLIAVACFDHKLADLTPEEFVDQIIVSRLKASVVVVGANFRFGRKRVGDVEQLCELGKERGFRVVSVEPMMVGGAKVSSTRVRNAIERGDVQSAARLLGRPFKMVGAVVTGQGLGRKLGFPTANLDVANGQIIPANGVYAVQVYLKGKSYVGACGIGTRPTVGGKGRTVEIHIVDFEDDILGAEICVAFECRLRDEVKFDTLDLLVAQMSRDVESAKEFVKNKYIDCQTCA